MPRTTVLLPTCNRKDSLIMVLGGLANQNISDFRLIISDQSSTPVRENAVVQALARIIEARGGQIDWHHRVPSKGVAEQRDFLLKEAKTETVLFLDDDVFMESWVLERLLEAMERETCGFVGAFPTGLTFRDDVRPDQQMIEYWDGRVHPETIEPEVSPEWRRWHLHRAANLWHVSQSLNPGEWRLYKVAWIASCVLYDRQKLVEVGGFEFWKRLPRWHSGEDVLVQNLLQRRWGGAALIPSGTYHSQLPSTVLNENGTIEGHALELLPSSR